MMRFEPVDEPADFDQRARQPGRDWLARNPSARRPLDYWSPFRPKLAQGFRHLCGYSVMYEPIGSIDHFLSFRRHPGQAYEWSNYRFASQSINSSKQDAEVLDPYEVEDGWFEILLPSLQLVLTAAVPVELRKKAAYTLERLRLRNDEWVIRQRSEWYRMYRSGELSLEGLRKKAPLIAQAVEKTGS
jgi:hypothetical protein